MEDQRFLEALSAFGGPRGETASRGAATFEMAARGVSPDEVCTVYRQVKPILERVVPMIEAIPVIGKATAAAIEALMTGLDAYCAAGQPRAVAPGVPSGDRAFAEAVATFQPSGARGLASRDIDVCGTYRKARPILEGVLPFLALIPQYGPAISAGLTALTTVLNKHCSVG